MLRKNTLLTFIQEALSYGYLSLKPFDLVRLCWCYFCEEEYLPPAIPVTNLPAYNPHILSEVAMQRKPTRKGMLLTWIALFLPKYSANTPDSTEPTGFVMTPRLAEKKKKFHCQIISLEPVLDIGQTQFIHLHFSTKTFRTSLRRSVYLIDWCAKMETDFFTLSRRFTYLTTNLGSSLY